MVREQTEKVKLKTRKTYITDDGLNRALRVYMIGGDDEKLAVNYARITRLKFWEVKDEEKL